MKPLKNLSPNGWVLLLTGLWAALNFVTAASTDLIGDETYYWVWSRDLAWGYFDHPPLVALIIRCGTTLFGATEFGVRLVAVLLHWGALNLLWRVVRTQASDRRSAWRYCLVVFSIPMLHIYGFITTPDVPLIFTMVLALWLFARFVKPNAHWLWAVALGAAVAAMGYSKYHAALVVVGLLLSDLKLLRTPKFYIALVVALLLMIPHLYWQSDNGWVSFHYHLSERNSPFAWEFVPEYIGNLIGCYNPFLMVPFLVLLWRKWGSEQVVRGVYMLAVFTMLFFLYSTCRGHVQPQWLLPIVPGLVLLVLRHAEQSARFGRYVLWGAGVMGVLLLAVRVFVFVRTEPMGPVDLWGSRPMIEKAERALGDVELIVLEGSYAAGSKFAFYGTIPVSVVPSLYSRSSQYQFMELDPSLAGKKTAYEIGDKGHLMFARDTLRGLSIGVRVPVYDTMLFDTVSRYLPTTAVRIEVQKVDSLVHLRIKNPYPYAIDGVGVVMHVMSACRTMMDRSLGAIELAPQATIDTAFAVAWPVGTVGFSLQQPLHGAWFNSQLYTAKP